MVAGVIAAIAAVITLVVVFAPHGASGSGNSPKSESSPQVTDVTPPVSDAPTSAPPSDSASDSQVESPTTLYLMNLPDDAFVRTPHWVFASKGSATISGVTYANSLIYEFQNCSNCDEPLEFVVPAGYHHLTGTFGLSDKSRHDNVIDGVVSVTVYDTAGNQILAPQRVEYPGSISVNVDISGQARVRIQMSQGTNFEQAFLGNVALVK